MSASTRPPPILETRNLTVELAGKTIIDNLNLYAPQQSIVGIWGANGSGKTTLLNVICREIRERSGSIHICGRSATNLGTADVVRLGLGRTFQSPLIVPGLTLRENLATSFASASRTAGRQDVDWASSYLSRCDLLPLEHVRAGLLSFGQKRLLEIGCVLARGPRLILMDEPTAGLSELSRRLVVGLIEEKKREGSTIVIIEHDVAFLRERSDAIYQLAHGRLIDAEPDAA